MRAKPRDELERRVRRNMWRRLVVPFMLVANKSETVVDPHFEFVRRLVLAALVVVELFQREKSFITATSEPVL